MQLPSAPPPVSSLLFVRPLVKAKGLDDFHDFDDFALKAKRVRINTKTLNAETDK